MTRQASQRHRLNRVVNFMHAHVGEDIDLKTLASVACLSKHHFARTYESRFGESPVRSLWRIRLEYAARRIVHEPEAAIGDVAMQTGFESHSTFTRAFARHFGASPSAFRRPPALSVPTIGDDGTPIAAMPADVPDTPVRIERCPTIRLGYIRQMGAYQRSSRRVQLAARLLTEWATRHGNGQPHEFIGLSHDNRRITPARFCRFDVGLRVDHSAPEDETISVLTIPAGRYAVASVACRNTEMLAIWEWLTFSWRRSRGAPYTQQWSYEVLHANPDHVLDPRSGVDLYLRLSD